MKNFLIVIIFLGISHIFQAQSSATASFMATATIIQPITINTVSHMNFSQIDAENGGSVVLTPDNTRFATGGVTLAGPEQFPRVAMGPSPMSGCEAIQVPTMDLCRLEEIIPALLTILVSFPKPPGLKGK